MRIFRSLFEFIYDSGPMSRAIKPSDFSGSSLLLLEDEAFDRLMAGETLDHVVRKQGGEQTDDLLLVYPRRACVDIAHSDRSNEYECALQFDAFLRNARFAVQIARDGEARQIRDSGLPSLYEWLEDKLKAGQRGRSYVQLNHQLDGGIEECLFSDIEKALRDKREVKGPISECSCGEPSCGSEYAWFANGVCVVLLRIIAGGTSKVRLFPFDVLEDFQDPHWIGASHANRPGMRADFDRYLWFRVNPEQFELLRHSGILEVDRESHEDRISEIALVTRDDVNREPGSDGFNLEQLLKHSLLARANYLDESAAGSPRAMLVLRDPSSAWELLQEAVLERRTKMWRMHYGPDLCAPGLRALHIMANDRILAEVVYSKDGIEQIRFLPRYSYDHKFYAL